MDQTDHLVHRRLLLLEQLCALGKLGLRLLKLLLQLHLAVTLLGFDQFKQL